MTLPFPPELLNITFSRVAKRELKILRLVCKRFEKAASQLLFDRVVISNNFACLKTAKAIIGSFSSAIKTVVFCPVFYQIQTQELYHREKIDVKHIYNESFAMRQHLDKAYATYCKLASEQQEILENGECLAILSVALRASTNTRTLVFSAPSAHYTIPEWNMARYGLNRDNLCPGSGCTVDSMNHPDFYITPESCYRRPMNEMWYPAMIALSASDSQISEIDMDSSDGWGWGRCLSISAFDSSRPQIKYVQDRMEMLVKLRLEVGVLPTDSAEQACYLRGDVAKALSTARNLESLWLHACLPNLDGNGQDRSIGSFEANILTPLDLFLGCCQFPRLQSLILQSFEASEPDLLALLQGSPRLQSLTLSVFSLIRGSWEGFVEQARGTLNLKRITLHYLHGFGYGDPCYEYFDWHTPMVDDFFFRSGKNPFSHDAMIQWAALHPPWWSGHHRGEYSLEWDSRYRELEAQYYGT